MNTYEIEVKAKLKINAFSASDATDVVEEAIRESESFGAEILELGFSSVKELN